MRLLRGAWLGAMSGGLLGWGSVSAWPAPKGGRVLGVGVLRFAGSLSGVQ